MTGERLIACHECDLIQRESPLPHSGVLRCCRCGAELYRSHADSLDHTLAYTLTSMILFGIANAFPIVGLAVNGNLVQTTLFGAVRVLYLDGMWPLATLVFATTILTPALQMTAIAYLMMPLRLGRVPYRVDMAFRLLRLVQPWGMTEVLILGLLVALVKLAHIASVVPGVALWSFGALMLLQSAASAAFDSREIWIRVGGAQKGGPSSGSPTALPASTAAGCGLMVCHSCGLMSKPAAHAHEALCPRCGARVHFRKLDSIARTWAFLIAAMILYIPANVLPVMHTSSLFGAQKDTIMSGVVYLWTSGSWPLAAIVFIASVVVPMLKILALVYLVASTQFHSRWQPQQRTRIYRLVEFVGRWSMLDIYVITMLVALVQFNALATISAGPAAVAFGAVVVLTMFAAMSFDPRLIWDTVEKDRV
ncbi:paraquat-inducible protein A [Paraburkholderia sp. BL23I1N1]|uniref:paraquat-inducible protein A n=1 Tax=Paraburkholderia sp. BL23I1N1 TaxID=1938802 RepID=UPI000E765F52|nr:paraquat-inducible protein A [Paraburkholderia sp. BL23I1N1]RKE39458.1 paraquat-inducible protein A [Paraburkholderia sp. BL23I1N1]